MSNRPLAGSAGTPSLAQIIGAADFTQHAIPRKEELDGAFARLSQAGLIGIDAEGASLTQAGQYVFAAVKAAARGVHDQLVTLADRIGASHWRSGEDPGRRWRPTSRNASPGPRTRPRSAPI